MWKKSAKPIGNVPAVGEDDFAGRPRTEERLAQILFGRRDFVRELLVLGERFDHPEDDRDVGRLRGNDSNALPSLISQLARPD